MKRVGIAFAVGGSVAAFLYLCATAGLRLGFAAADWMARRRDIAAQRKDYR